MHLSADASVLSNSRAQTLCCGGVLLDVQRRQGFVGDVDLGLSPAEFAMLYLLFQRRGIPMSKEAIGAVLPVQVDPRMIDVYVSRARGKLAAAGLEGTIETVWGRGYMAADSDSPAPAEPCTLPGLGATLVHA